MARGARKTARRTWARSPNWMDQVCVFWALILNHECFKMVNCKLKIVNVKAPVYAETEYFNYKQGLCIAMASIWLRRINRPLVCITYNTYDVPEEASEILAAAWGPWELSVMSSKGWRHDFPNRLLTYVPFAIMDHPKTKTTNNDHRMYNHNEPQTDLFLHLHDAQTL